jgi:ABC-type phosphonate transport system ATPase subunit
VLESEAIDVDIRTPSGKMDQRAYLARLGESSADRLVVRDGETGGGTKTFLRAPTLASP